MTQQKKKKVLIYYTYENHMGGPRTYIRSIMESSLKDQYEFKVCYQNCSPGGINIGLLKRMVATIRAEKPDIVHVQGLQSEGFYGALASKMAGCKHVVMTVHGFAFDGDEIGKLKKWLYRHVVEPLTLRLSNRVFCVCESASKRIIIQKHAGKRNYGYIYNPVPPMKITTSRTDVRQGLGVDEQETLFVIAGRIVEGKGFGILENAVKRLNAEEVGGFRLLVLGDGDYRATFEQNMSDEIRSGQVMMTGLTDRVPDYLAASDVFILPSYHENLPIALLEAGEMGLPCIASDVDGIPEIIRNRETGLLVDSFNFEDYANAMKYMLTHRENARKMGACFQADVQERFSMEGFCEKLTEVYET